MNLIGDLDAESLMEAMPGRPARSYPALLSTEADALAWARSGAAGGSIVVSEYQASPRGRGGLEWRPEPGRSLAFSMVLRPAHLPIHREGWLYTVAVSGLADVLGGGIEWPDVVPGRGAVGITVEAGPAEVTWAVVNFLVEGAEPPRAPLLARLAAAVEARMDEPSARVLADYLPRCATFGRRVSARLIPLSPGGAAVIGTARTLLADGALVIQTEDARRIAVRPQAVGVLELQP